MAKSFKNWTIFCRKVQKTAFLAQKFGKFQIGAKARGAPQDPCHRGKPYTSPCPCWHAPCLPGRRTLARKPKRRLAGFVPLARCMPDYSTGVSPHAGPWQSLGGASRSAPPYPLACPRQRPTGPILRIPLPVPVYTTTRTRVIHRFVHRVIHRVIHSLCTCLSTSLCTSYPQGYPQSMHTHGTGFATRACTRALAELRAGLSGIFTRVSPMFGRVWVRFRG